MADASPNPQSWGDFSDMLLRNGPVAAYQDAALKQAQLGAMQQAYQENALKLQYAPQDLYNQAMQQKTATIKGMKPFEQPMMENLLRTITNPTQQFAMTAEQRLAQAEAERKGVAPAQLAPAATNTVNPMDPAAIGQEKDLINSALKKGKPISGAPNEGGLNSIVLPYVAQEIAKARGQAAPSVPAGGFSQLGPQDLTQSPAPQASQAPPPSPFGYNPPPSGIAMNDPMAVAKFAQGVDPNQMLSTDLEKVFPSTASAIAMSMRNIPTAAATMANNASTDLQKEREFQQKLQEIDLSREDKATQNKILDALKASQDRMNAMLGAEKVGTSTGRGGAHTTKDPREAADKALMDKLNQELLSKQSNFDPTDKHDQKAFAKMMGPMIRNTYNAIQTPMYREQLRALHPEIDFGAVTPSSPAGQAAPPPGGMVQVRIKEGRPGAGTVVQRPIGIYNAHPELYERVGQ